jgi:hypothetical protein
LPSGWTIAKKRQQFGLSLAKGKSMHDNSQAISEALEAERRRLAARLRESLINPMSLIQAQVHAYEMSAG